MGKTGLVLEGGGMRGLFSAGVVDVLLENDIHLDAVVGVSAGACFGCNYPSHQQGRALRYNLTYAHDKRYCSFKALLRTGDLFGAEFCYDYLPLTLDPFDAETFGTSGIPFWVVCTNVATGEAVYHQCGSDVRETLSWIRASSSMPIVSRTVRIGTEEYLDGGIADPIPLRFFVDEGYERNIVVLTQPIDYVKKQSSVFPAMRLALRKQPAIAAAMERRPEVYNDSRSFVLEQQQAGAALVLCPDDALPAGRTEHDRAKLQATYDAGRRVAERNLDTLRDFVAPSTRPVSK